MDQHAGFCRILRREWRQLGLQSGLEAERLRFFGDRHRPRDIACRSGQKSRVWCHVSGHFHKLAPYMDSVSSSHHAPQPISWRKLPPNLGEGLVRFYDARAGLPEVVDQPPSEHFREKGAAVWVLVHFPSRRWFAVKSKKAALSILDDIKAGKENPALEKFRLSPAKASRSAPAPASKVPVENPAGESEAPGDTAPQENTSEAPANKAFTEVPEGLDFDKAMKLVFPVGRITKRLEMLLTASTSIYSKDGIYCGEREEYQVQLQALKTLIEYHQGRPNEKEKVKEVKPPLSIEELRRKMVMSDEYRAGFEEMVKQCAAEAELRRKEEKNALKSA